MCEITGQSAIAVVARVRAAYIVVCTQTTQEFDRIAGNVYVSDLEVV
jgi:hypothetical protein